ncbi:putative bifunctional diguanylate cyclase/phosphodiesterase [Paeniroseomonas aquatica]|nr:EAL domain-containing protein [Paeniroseomonas aquatica]
MMKRPIAGLSLPPAVHQRLAGLTLNVQTLEGLSDAIAIADLTQPDMPLIYVNSACERIMGYAAAEILGRNCRFLQGADRQQPEIADMARAIAARREVSVVLRNYRKDGTMFWNELRLRPMRDDDGTPTHYLATSRDVTACRDRADRLQRAATHDDVTGLPIPRRFLARLEAERAWSDALMLLCCDADRLRDVNGTYGRAAGDAVLRELGRRLQAAAGSEAACRLAAGQFAVALRLPCGADAAAVAAGLHRAIAEPLALPGITVAMTVSLGWAVAQTHTEPAEAVLIRAETALYAAKAAGRGEVRAYDPATERQSRRRLRLTAELRNALTQQEFVLHYQPKVEIATGRIVGLEALLRWQHPVFGLQSPERFLGVAEESGLIVEIGAWALAEASRFAAMLHRHGHAVYVAVNVSPVQFQRDDIAALMRRVLAEAGAEPGWVALELTETMLADSSPRTAACFAELRRLGIGLAMDDFGTGFASLQCLRSLPFTEIKVDRSFVHGLDRDPVQAAMVGAALGVARALGIVVTCEGIETAAERDRLAELGCPVAQGYFFSLPLAGEDLVRLLDTHAVLPVAEACQPLPGARVRHGHG